VVPLLLHLPPEQQLGELQQLTYNELHFGNNTITIIVSALYLLDTFENGNIYDYEGRHNPSFAQRLES
jgi:hypothetical protein